MNGKTTVVIMSHNYEDFLEQSLLSALQQTRSAARIVIIDDASQNNVRPLIEPYLGDTVEFHRVDFRNHQKTRNFGLTRARSEYVLFLDADDYMATTMLERLEDALDRHPEARLAYCDKTVFGNSEAMARLNLSSNWQAGAFSLERLRFKNFIMATSLIRRSNIEAFDEHILRLADWDTWLTILDDDKHAVYVPEPLLNYRVHGKNVSIQRRELIERLKIMTRHGLIERDTNETQNRCQQPVFITLNPDLAKIAPWRDLAQSMGITLRAIVGHTDWAPDTPAQITQAGGASLQTAPASDLEDLIRRYAGTITAPEHDLVQIIEHNPQATGLNAFSTAKPVLRCTLDNRSLLACRSLEEAGVITLSPNAIRLLLYIQPVAPVSAAQRMLRQLKALYVRHLGWRFSPKQT